jgi:hypothetical protein
MKLKILIVFSFIFLNDSLFSQIITHLTNDTIVLDLQNPVGMDEKIDIDQNGVNEFSLYLSGAQSDPSAWFSAITDSTDILHEYFLEGGASGYKAVNQTDSLTNQSSDWMVIQETSPTASSGVGWIHSTRLGYVPQFLNKTFYTGIRFYIEGSDLISRFHYGCINATLTQNEKLIVHSWSYESTPEKEIECSDEYLINDASLTNHSKQQNIQISPNPNVNGTFKTNINISNIQVYNSYGKEVQSTFSDNKFSINKTSQGVYYVIINNSEMRKIVIL